MKLLKCMRALIEKTLLGEKICFSSPKTLHFSPESDFSERVTDINQFMELIEEFSFCNT